MSITYKEYNEKYRLPEQERDEKRLISKKHYALCYEPGKGKSYPVIHAIIQVSKMLRSVGVEPNVLILSDAACIKDMWKAEIVPQGILPKNTYMVTDRTAIGAVKEALLKTKWHIIVCDECQSLRSGVTRAKSQYAKLVYQLTKRAEYVWGMTGTIAGNNNIEPFCVLHNLNIAGCGEMNCHRFKERYCVQEIQYGPFGAFHKPVRLNEFGEEYMEAAFAEGCSFWEYDENDKMPPMDVKFINFNVPETEAYKNALDGILKCGEHESTVMKSIAMQKAQQALNGFVYYNDEEDDMTRKTFRVPKFYNPKLDYVLSEALKKSLVVAYRFQEDGYYINKVLNEAGLKTTDTMSDFRVRAARGEHLILVIQCSRGKSANLQAAQKIIYYTADHSFISYKQMIHRCWRRGQDKPCEVDFLCNELKEDTHHVERKIWNSLRTKQSIHDCLMSIKNKEVI